MELHAAIAGLAALKERCAVSVFTDSQYFQQGMDGHVRRWRTSIGWRNSRGEPAANRDLREELIRVSNKQNVIWHWVRGHSVNVHQNHCDRLAKAAARSAVRAA